MAYLGSRYLLTAAAESAYGVFEDNADRFNEINPLAEGFSWSVSGPKLLDVELIRGDGDNSPSLLGTSDPKLAIKIHARGGGSITAQEQPASICSELEVPLVSCLGQPTAGIGTVIVAGNSLTSFDVAASDAMLLHDVIWVDPCGTGNVEACAIVGLDGETFEVWPPLSDVPDDNGCVYAGCNFRPYVGEIASSSCWEKSTVSVAGKRAVERSRGMAGNVTVEKASAGEYVKLKFDLQGFADQSSESAQPLVLVGEAGNTSDGKAQPWPAQPQPLKAVSAKLCIGDSVALRHQSFEYSPMAGLQRRQDVSFPDGKASHFISAWKEEGSVSVPWNQELKVIRDSGECCRLLWVCGNAANGMALFIPEAQLGSIEQANHNGEEFMKMNFKATHSKSGAQRVLHFSGRRSV